MVGGKMWREKADRQGAVLYLHKCIMESNVKNFIQVIRKKWIQCKYLLKTCEDTLNELSLLQMYLHFYQNYRCTYTFIHHSQSEISN